MRQPNANTTAVPLALKPGSAASFGVPRFGLRCFLFGLLPVRCSSVPAMSPEWLAALARYNRWMNDKLYEVSASLSDEARKRDVGAFFKSIHGTLNHLLLGDRIWLARFKGVSPPAGILTLDQELYADFEDLRRERALTDDELSAWVAGLSHEQLAATLSFMRRGQLQESPLWWSALHVFNHQTHHRGQVTTLLMQQGVDPGATDLVAMLREEAARATTE
jgi:uncharacterized damage-inducible protein DinB